MLYQIISFVLEVATSLFGGACLLRLYMQHQRVPFGNLLKLTQFGLLWLLAGGLAAVGWVPLLAVFGLVQMAISGLTGLLIVYAILSWTQAGSPLSAVIDRLCAPFLAPFRRILPLVGGIDLSPLVLLVVLQVAAMVLASLQQSMLR